MINFAGHFLIFSFAAIFALLAPLTIGRFIRPKLPTPEKNAIYECGEPTIGSSYIQFDLRFYVVALLFIIFDVELAFFFPWAMVYGNAMQLADSRLSETAREHISAKLQNIPLESMSPEYVISSDTAMQLGVTGLCDILVFFGVLLVGFAYVWKRGDLDWIRAMTQQAKQSTRRPAETMVPKAAEELQAV